LAKNQKEIIFKNMAVPAEALRVGNNRFLFQSPYYAKATKGILLKSSTGRAIRSLGEVWW
jgi:hypothetical protein